MTSSWGAKGYLCAHWRIGNMSMGKFSTEFHKVQVLESARYKFPSYLNTVTNMARFPETEENIKLFYFGFTSRTSRNTPTCENCCILLLHFLFMENCSILTKGITAIIYFQRTLPPCIIMFSWNLLCSVCLFLARVACIT